ncbi:MAG: prepilin-type N-terminal cleavage/methylation domain-containing protein [Pirellulaceae bacterium]|nr:prepilin-type N-terminal cleavage/methylation domain-containing protein [Pirellulaceae bacterium]
MKRRRGFTLVEMIVVLAIGSTVLTLAIGMVDQSMLISSATKSGCQRQLATNRFLEQFRSDIHQGTKVDSDSPDSLTVFSSDDSKIVYRTEHNRILREQFKASQSLRREELFLDDRELAGFEFQAANSLAVLQISSRTDFVSQTLRVDRRVEAMVGLTPTSISISEKSQ